MEDGFFLRIGRQVAKVAPGLAHISLALPAAFTRWAQGLLNRLFNENTIGGIFLSGILALAVGVPSLGIYQLYLSGPSNKEVHDFFVGFSGEILDWLGKSNQFDSIWFSLCLILVLAVLPWLLKFYLWVVFSSLGFVIWWLVFLIAGYDLSQVGESPKTQQTMSSAEASGRGDGVATETPAQVSEMAPSAEEGSSPPIRSPIEPIKQDKNPAGVSISAESVAATSNESVPPATLVALDKHHREMKSRIDSLLSDLRGRQETNLGLGMLFSIVGVVILAGLVFYGTHAAANDKVEFLLWFIPRLSIVIFIQVFAYFFLGLYRGNLIDIKYFNNELTNMEYKRMGAEVALLEGNSANPLVPQFCLELLKVERNFVLRKGESSVDLRDDKDGGASDINLGQAIKAIKALTEALEKKP